MMLEDWQQALLAGSRVGHLATIARDGRPRLVPVCFALVGEEIAIAVDEKPKASTDLARLRDVRRDPRATLLVDRYDDEDWSRLMWVRLEATAAVVAEGREWAEGLGALRARYPQYRGMALEERPLLRLTVTRVVGWRAEGAAGESSC